MKIFNTTDFAYHKVSVVFWQTDENDKPAHITEPYTKVFTPANIKKEQEYYDSEMIFLVNMKSESVTRKIEFTLSPKDDFASIFEAKVKGAFADEISALMKDLKTAGDKNKIIKRFIKFPQC